MVYVCTTNIVSLSIAYLLSYDQVKLKLGIPVLSASEQLQAKIAAKSQKGFIEAIKSQFENEKIADELKRRDELKKRIDDLKKATLEKSKLKAETKKKSQ
jgi:hypothetical protein